MNATAYRTKAGTPLAERFERLVSPEPMSGCHLWTGAVTRAGYGFMRISGRTKPATHVALDLSGTPRPAGNSLACHKCDTPSCVNPEHLFWGSQADNMADQRAKGRHWATRAATCAKGHAWTQENTRVGRDGRKNCRTCERDRLALRKTKRAGRIASNQE